jgi:hypothetical protein
MIGYVATTFPQLRGCMAAIGFEPVKARLQDRIAVPSQVPSHPHLAPITAPDARDGLPICSAVT